MAQRLCLPRVVLEAPEWRCVRPREGAPPYYYHTRTCRASWSHPSSPAKRVPVADVHSHPLFRKRRDAQADERVIETWGAGAEHRSTLTTKSAR